MIVTVYGDSSFNSLCIFEISKLFFSSLNIRGPYHQLARNKRRPSLRMLHAALMSRSKTAPQFGHVIVRMFKSRFPKRNPQEEQIWELGKYFDTSISGFPFSDSLLSNVLRKPCQLLSRILGASFAFRLCISTGSRHSIQTASFVFAKCIAFLFCQSFRWCTICVSSFAALLRSFSQCLLPTAKRLDF